VSPENSRSLANQAHCWRTAARRLSRLPPRGSRCANGGTRPSRRHTSPHPGRHWPCGRILEVEVAGSWATAQQCRGRRVDHSVPSRIVSLHVVRCRPVFGQANL